MTRLRRPGIWYVLRTALRISPLQSLLIALEGLGNGINALLPIFIGLLVDAVVNQDASAATLPIALLVGCVGLNMATQAVGANARIRQLEHVGFEFDHAVTRTLAEIPTVSHTSDPTLADDLQALRDNSSALGTAFNSVVNAMNNLVYVVVTLVAAFATDWRLLLLLIFTVPQMLQVRWFTHWEQQAETIAAPLSRRNEHALSLATEARPGMESRVYGLAGTLRAMVTSSVRDWRTPNVRVAERTALAGMAMNLVFLIPAAVIITLLASEAAAGAITVGTVVAAMGLVAGLQNSSLTVSRIIRELARTLRNVRRFTSVRDFGLQRAASPEAVRPTSVKPTGITLDEVTVRYPGAHTPALSEVTLNLPAGAVVALVGENGAGKTTLARLLLGMHNADSGQVRLDGVDLATIDPVWWRRRTTATLQYFLQPKFTAAHAVALGDVDQLDNTTAMEQAVTDANARPVIDRLPHGYATQLGNDWPNGVDLSGGQWQRLAVARSLMPQAPRLIVLDEPTSALDPAAEDAMLTSYLTAAQRARGHGATTLFVTHRLSLARDADLVVVLQDGAVLEVGTHAELMRNAGMYAELFQTQAAGYR